jgi:hypothetical protein
MGLYTEFKPIILDNLARGISSHAWLNNVLRSSADEQLADFLSGRPGKLEKLLGFFNDF